MSSALTLSVALDSDKITIEPPMGRQYTIRSGRSQRLRALVEVLAHTRSTTVSTGPGGRPVTAHIEFSELDLGVMFQALVDADPAVHRVRETNGSLAKAVAHLDSLA